ncbi:TetR family transcriptional regulator C-terminal domain-containing protein [Nitrospirota bacterium]
MNEARDLGHLSENIDETSVAEFIINSWEGAILRSRVTRDGRHLRLFEQQVFDMLVR